MNVKIPTVIYADRSSFITLNRRNWKTRCYINCHSIKILYFLSCNSCDGNTTYTGKTVNFRHRMNNHVTACRFATEHPPINLIIMFLNVVIRTNIMKINCYVVNLTYIKWDFIQ